MALYFVFLLITGGLKVDDFILPMFVASVSDMWLWLESISARLHLPFYFLYDH